MSPESPRSSQMAGTIRVRLWAGARAAAGVGEVEVAVAAPVSVAWVRDAVIAALPGRDRLPGVLGVCSVLVGERPLGGADPASRLVEAGATVEFLPPFAGG